MVHAPMPGIDCRFGRAAENQWLNLAEGGVPGSVRRKPCRLVVLVPGAPGVGDPNFSGVDSCKQAQVRSSNLAEFRNRFSLNIPIVSSLRHSTQPPSIDPQGADLLSDSSCDPLLSYA